MRLDTQPNPTLERTYTERRLTQLWCKMQDTPPDSPMIVQAIPWHSMQTQKTTASFFPFLCRHGFLERISVSRGLLFRNASFYFLFMFLHALEEMIPPLFMRCFFLFFFSLVARDIRPQELPVIRWNTSTKVDWCFPLASFCSFRALVFFSLASIIDRLRDIMCVSLFFLYCRYN